MPVYAPPAEMQPKQQPRCATTLCAVVARLRPQHALIVYLVCFTPPQPQPRGGKICGRALALALILRDDDAVAIYRRLPVPRSRYVDFSLYAMLSFHYYSQKILLHMPPRCSGARENIPRRAFVPSHAPAISIRARQSATAAAAAI